MTDFYKNFFSERDDRIQSAGLEDPLGFQGIWPEFGQRIFGLRVTGRTRSLRLFLVTLFNHYVVWSSRNNHSFTRKEIESRMLFLESLMVYSLVNYNDNQDNQGKNGKIDIRGFAGQDNASKRLKKGDEIFLPKSRLDEDGNENSAYLVVRQHDLGVSSRHNTPFRNMGYLKKNNDGYSDKNDPKLSDEEKEGMKFIENFLEDLQRDVSSEEIMKELEKGVTTLKTYLEAAFPKEENDSDIRFSIKTSELPNIAHIYEYLLEHGAEENFWLDILGLGKEGTAANAIAKVLMNNKASESADILNIAKNDEHLSELELEKTKIQDILTLEKFLCVAQWYFDVLCDSKKLEEAKDKIQKNIQKNKDFHLDLEKVSQLHKKEDKTRLNHLIQCFQTEELENQLHALIDYHKNLKGPQLAWIFPDDKGNLRSRKTSGRDLSQPQKWLNDYYIGSVWDLISSWIKESNGVTQ